MFLGANNRVAGLFKASFEPPAPRTLIPVDVDSNRQPTLDRSVFITKQLANARLIVLLLPILDQLLCTPNIGFQTLNYPANRTVIQLPGVSWKKMKWKCMFFRTVKGIVKKIISLSWINIGKILISFFLCILIKVLNTVFLNSIFLSYKYRILKYNKKVCKNVRKITLR